MVLDASRTSGDPPPAAIAPALDRLRGDRRAVVPEHDLAVRPAGVVALDDLAGVEWAVAEQLILPPISRLTYDTF